MDIFCKNVHGRVVIRYLAFIIWNLKIFYVIFLKKMVVWVAVLPRVDQLTKVMPNFWRAVYITNVCNWSLDMTPVPLKVFCAKLKFEICWNFEELSRSQQKCHDNVTVMTCLIIVWSAEYVLNKGIRQFRWISNSIEILTVGRSPHVFFFFNKNTMPSWYSL